MMEYDSGLQKLYDEGKAKQDEEINYADACEIIQESGVSLAQYNDEVCASIVGMTRIEAFMFLNEFFSRLDEADGTADGFINTQEGVEKLLHGAGVTSSDKLSNCTDAEVLDTLMEKSDVFKQQDNQADAGYIEGLKAIQNSDGPTGTETENIWGDSLFGDGAAADESFMGNDAAETGDSSQFDLLSILPFLLLGMGGGLGGSGAPSSSGGNNSGNGNSLPSFGSGGDDSLNPMNGVMDAIKMMAPIIGMIAGINDFVKMQSGGASPKSSSGGSASSSSKGGSSASGSAGGKK